MKLLHLLMHVGKILKDRIREGLDEAGVHHGQGRVLSALARNRPLSQIEIAEGLHLSRASVTNMIRRMERDGLVTRTPDKSDRRVLRVHLTPAGRKAEKHVRKTWEDMEAILRNALPADEAEKAHHILRALRDGLGGKDPDI